MALLAAVMGATVPAVAVPVTVTTQVVAEADSLTVGDPIRYRVTVRADSGLALAKPTWAGDLKPFVVLDSLALVEDQPSHVGDQAIWAYQAVLSAYQTGDLEIPGVQVVYRDTAGTPQTVMAAPVAVRIASVLGENAQDIRDIKDLLDVADVFPRGWWWGGLLVLLFGAIGYWIYRRRRHRQHPPQEPSVLLRPPHEIAYQELERIARSGWLEQGLVKRYYSALADVIRRYLAARYGIVTMEVTTRELMEGMVGAGLGTEIRAAVAHLLDECDLVKFARLRPSWPVCEEAIPRARTIVEKSEKQFQAKQVALEEAVSPQQSALS